MAEASKQAERSYLNRIMAEAPFFSGAAADDTAELARHARSIAVARGKMFAPPKGKEAEAWLIVSGAAALLERDAATGRSVLIALMGPGDIIGLVSAAENGEPAPAAPGGEWRALANVTAIAIPIGALKRVMRRSPELTDAHLSSLARSLRQVTARFAASILHPLETRLAAFLEELGAIAAGNRWDPTANVGRLQQTQIAEMLGVSREHVNRTLTMWERSGLIFQTKSGDLIIENRKRLAEIAGARRAPGAASQEIDRIWEIESHINLGLNAAAYDLALEGARRAPKDDRFKYFAVLAMARMGSLAEAIALAQSFKLTTDAANEDIASVIPRLQRDLAFEGESPDCTLLASAAEGFEKVYDALKTAYPGVNAAASWAMSGDLARAQQIARTVSAKAAATLNDTDEDEPTYWARATLAECQLIGGEIKAAEAGFRSAVNAADAAPGKIAATRKQLRRLKTAVGVDDSWIDRNLPQGRVLFFCGPLTPPDDPQDVQHGRLRDEVLALLDRKRFTAAIGALAAGADIVIAETLIDEGVPLHACLPLQPGAFLASSVAPAVGDWRERYIACIERAQTVDWLRFSAPSRGAYRLGARVAMGRAMRLADDLATAPFGFFSVQKGRDAANSISIENHEIWTALGLESKAVRDEWLPVTGRAGKTQTERNFFFALVIDGAAREECDSIARPAALRVVRDKTLSIYAFDTPGGAVRAAKEVAGSKAGRTARIWLDAAAEDNFNQSLITAACRPQTPPGKIFASEGFACSMTATPGPRPAFDYAGFSPADEKIAPCPLYLVGA